VHWPSGSLILLTLLVAFLPRSSRVWHCLVHQQLVPVSPPWGHFEFPNFFVVTSEGFVRGVPVICILFFFHWLYSPCGPWPLFSVSWSIHNW
jgi:hypothetical protein